MKNKLHWILIIIIIIILLIFGSINFISRSHVLNENESIEIVKALPEVKEYLKRVPNAKIVKNGKEINSYLIQVFEIKDNHTATFNWYKVDKTTGEVKKEF